MIPQDPVMLLSYVNMKLRDSYSSLDALCDDLDLDKQELCRKLSAIDYIYSAMQDQFQPKNI